MDWSTAAVTIAAMSFLLICTFALIFLKVMMWIVRSAARTTKKTAHVISSPFIPKR